MELSDLTPEEVSLIKQRRKDSLDPGAEKAKVIQVIVARMEELQISPEQLAKESDTQTYALKLLLSCQTDPRLSTLIRLGHALDLKVTVQAR